MSDIVKQVFVDLATGQQLDINTRYVVRTVNIPTRVKVPLYKNGAMISQQELSRLGLQIKSYTREEIEAQEYAGYYSKNPTLAVRVRQYAQLLFMYGLPASATSDQITQAIMQSSMTDAQKTAAAASLLALIHDIQLNWNQVSGDGLTAWSVMDKLIEYLPVQSNSQE